MKAIQRFLILLLFILIFIFGLKIRNNIKRNNNKNSFETNFYSLNQFKVKTKSEKPLNSCRLNTCFDLNKCLQIGITGLRIHLYGGSNGQQKSQSFSKIEEIISSSNYLEKNPQKACLFMNTLWDPLDRDPLSRDYQRSNALMSSSSALFNGINHIFFNLYSGSWPNYSELDFSYNQNYGKIKEILQKAILIKASQSRDSYRRDFDVSLPLFSRSHPIRGPHFVSHESEGQGFVQQSEEKSIIRQNSYSSYGKRLLLVFKGKRYIYGIGSETRNSLHYLNNNKDVLVLTTCKHGKKWKDFQNKDQKCETDNHLYDKYDYFQLMANSTFCLVPRGRRLGSYRFLEALQLGCIPVILSNGWVLPFQEIIDWKSCVVLADERLLLQIPETLRSFSKHKISEMRHKCLLFYEKYFSSVERIVFTSLLIIEMRIKSHVSIHHFSQSLSSSASSLPLLFQLSLIPLENNCPNQLTIIIHITQEVEDFEKLIKRLLHISVVHEVVILSPNLIIPVIREKRVRFLKSNNRFSLDSTNLSTDAVLQLSPQTLLSEEEILFAFSVWNSFPQRIIGFIAKSHYFKDNEWQYSSKWSNEYSLVEMDSAIYHKRFHDLFIAFNQNTSNCSDLWFLFLVSHITREGPLKVTQRKRSLSSSYYLFLERKQCFSLFEKKFSYFPLIQSKLRLDPLLFKDNVSIKRKKYRKIEFK